MFSYTIIYGTMYENLIDREIQNMEFSLEFFANDRYALLKMLLDNQIKVKDDFYVPLSQQEIADMIQFSKLKTNRLLNELKDNGFIDCFNGKRGKYVITEKGHKVLQLMQKMNV